MKKIAIVMCNLGGPASLEDVRSFLFELFYDKRIIPVKKPLRYLIAKIISFQRYKKSQSYYQMIGCKSPLLKETYKQSVAFQEELDKLESKNIYKTFVAMRYSSPKIGEIINDLNKFNPSEVILLPLYPHFSFATTLSFFDEWERVYKLNHLKFAYKSICCYFNNKLFIDAYFKLIFEKYELSKKVGCPRVIFSAHSVPVNYIKKGDPYEKQICESVDLIISRFKDIGVDLDYIISYQSKIGPVEWLKPSTEDEIKSIKDSPVILVPISFVADNLETLYELDIFYKGLFFKEDMFFRVSVLGITKEFINCLVNLVVSDNVMCCGDFKKKCFFR